MSIGDEQKSDHVTEMLEAIRLGLNRLEFELLRKAGNVPRHIDGVHRIMKKLRALLLDG
jgi:hypothetical protein